MDRRVLFVCFVTLFASSFGQEAPLEVKFVKTEPTVNLAVGAQDVHFQCHLNRDANFLLNRFVNIIRVNPVTLEETILTNNGQYKGDNPDEYSVQLKLADKGLGLDFRIHSVRDVDDGKYICKVMEGTNEIGRAEKEIVIHRPIEALKLKIGDFEPVMESMEGPLDLDPDTYNVTCVAEGSNPATEHVHLFLDGKKIPHSEPVIVAMKSPIRKFRTTIFAMVDIMVKNAGQEIQCQATDSSQNSKTSKITLSVNTYDPEVVCNDTHAYIGEMNPVLVCRVNHSEVEVTGYAFQMGDSGEIIRQGAAHSKNIRVMVEDVSPGISDVTLDLHKAEHSYLDKHYYLLVDIKGGHTSKSSVRLHKTAAPEKTASAGFGGGGGAESLSAPSCLLFTLVAALFLLSL